MLGSILVLFLFMMFISVSIGVILAHLTWTPPIGGK